MLLNGTNLHDLFKVVGSWLPSQPSPESADRVMTCGFSMLQHIGAGARVNMWLPKAGTEISHPPLEWVAIRQVEVLQEGCHIELFDMEMEHFKRSLVYFNSARARGRRLAIILGGHYSRKTSSIPNDHLVNFDNRFHDRLQSMVNLLWMQHMQEVTSRTKCRINEEWDVTSLLPHVGTTLNAMQLFRPKALMNSQQGHHHALARGFMDEIQRMPRQSVREHSVTVGLMLPKHQDDNDIDWGPSPEFSRAPFMNALFSVFGAFGMGTPTTHHPRSYGDHMDYQKRNNYTPLMGFAHA